MTNDGFFPDFRREGDGLLASVLSIEINGREVIIAAASRKALLETLTALDPNTDWGRQPQHPVRVDFLGKAAASGRTPHASRGSRRAA